MVVKTTYTDTDGAVTTTSYGAAGRVAAVADPTGTTTYTYDGADERRGLVAHPNPGCSRGLKPPVSSRLRAM